MNFWPISKKLLIEILADRISDKFVCYLIWERLGYIKSKEDANSWIPGPNTSEYWTENFSCPPLFISQRKASVQLSRSIKNEYKQSLKNYLSFEGYKINELYPRRTRRATAVNWLIFWVVSNGKALPLEGPLPDLLEQPSNPLNGHPGDCLIE